MVLLSYFNETFKAFLEAEQTLYSIDRFYMIGHQLVQLRFAGQTLIDALCPALEHLRTKPAMAPALTICIWDGASTEKSIPSLHWKGKAVIAENVQSSQDGIQPVIYFRDERFRGAYQTGTKTLSMLDTKRNFAIFYVTDVHKISYYERGAPLRTILQWWVKEYGFLMIHAGAVGTNSRGVLIAGESGSGKSTTALACLHSGLSYVSDDYCLLGMESYPFVKSVYCSAKLDWQGLQRFPAFVSAVENTDGNNTDKALLLLNKHYPQKIVRGFPIRAILLPRISGRAATNAVPVSPKQGLMTIAPSTIFQSCGANQADLTFMARLTRLIPSFVLEVGSDTENIPDIVLSILSKT
jgi:hypothetical protein